MDAAASAPSPKRRAPLAALDVNAMPSSPRTLKRKSPRPLRDDGDGEGDASPAAGGAKRPAGAGTMDASPAAKKPCLERYGTTWKPAPADAKTHKHQQRSPSRSPDSSSVFDTSVADASCATMATTTTEPDLVDSAAPPARRLTREQAREKVEILRLRLSLATYKLRTGQTAVPLTDLQPRPLPSRRTVRVQSPSQDSLSSSMAQHQQQRLEQACSSLLQQQHRPCLDDTATAADFMSGRDQDRSAVGEPHQHRALDGGALVAGGAANGLLSFARGCEMR